MAELATQEFLPDASVKHMTWGLVIATYQREEILLRCLSLAAAQTRPPAEIIVVDASPGWEATKASVMGGLAPTYPQIRWDYRQARMPRQTAQRNQGIEAATADVLFMIDDDSLMAPTCAERLMLVYEQGADGRIAGVIPQASEQCPDRPAVPVPKRGLRRVREMAQVGRLMWDLNVLLKGPFFPAFAALPAMPIPELPCAVQRIDRMQGYLLTVRREVAAREGFDSDLMTSEHEDSEASWRFAQQGVLLQLQEPLIFHVNAPRPKQLTRNGARWRAFWLLNHAYLCRKLFGSDPRTVRHIKSYAQRTAALDFFLGLLSRRMDRWQGCLLARKGVAAIAEADARELVTVYSRYGRAITDTLRVKMEQG